MQVEYIEVTFPNMTTRYLEYCTEWNIVKGRVQIYIDLPDCTDIHVNYWSRGDAHGVTPGNLPWEDILVGCGMYYVTDFVPGVGGWMILKANQQYFLETPPLGEIDWKWYWIKGFKPRDGYYNVSMCDIVMVQHAYWSSGNGVPPPHWFPGADLSLPECEIDVFDVVQVVWNFGVIFGSPEPNPPPPPKHYDMCDECGPLIYVDPRITHWNSVPPGDNFTISVKIFNLTTAHGPDPENPLATRPLGNLYGLDIIFIWNASVLEYLSHQVTIPVETYPGGILHQPAMQISDSVDPVAGTYSLAYSSQYPANPFNNPGLSNMVFNMTFQVKKEACSELLFTWIELPDKDGKAILFDEQDGIFTIPGDLDGDGDVDMFDFFAFADNYGKTCL